MSREVRRLLDERLQGLEARIVERHLRRRGVAVRAAAVKVERRPALSDLPRDAWRARALVAARLGVACP